MQCEAGLLSVTGTAEAPAKAGISVADIAAGMYAFSGVLTALYERERTGAGTSVEVAMLDALGEWMSQPYLFAVYGGEQPRRTGARHASISPYGPYAAADGQVFVGLQNEREWAVLCRDILGQPELIGDPRFATNTDRVAHDDELTLIIEAALRTLTAAEVETKLDSAGIANARLRTPAEFAVHPQLGARDRWRDVGTPGGPVRALLPPVAVSGREAAMGDVPALGQHTAAILAELGFDPRGVARSAAPSRPAGNWLARSDDLARQPAGQQPEQVTLAGLVVDDEVVEPVDPRAGDRLGGVTDGGQPGHGELQRPLARLVRRTKREIAARYPGHLDVAAHDVRHRPRPGEPGHPVHARPEKRVVLDDTGGRAARCRR